MRRESEDRKSGSRDWDRFQEHKGRKTGRDNERQGEAEKLERRVEGEGEKGGKWMWCVARVQGKEGEREKGRY